MSEEDGGDEHSHGVMRLEGANPGRRNELEVQSEKDLGKPDQWSELQPGWSYATPEHKDERDHRLTLEKWTHAVFLMVFVAAVLAAGVGIAFHNPDLHKDSEQLGHMLIGALAGFFAGRPGKKGGG